MPVGFVRTYCQSGLGGFRFFVEGLGFSLGSLQGWIRVSRAREEAAAAKALSADDFLESLLLSNNNKIIIMMISDYYQKIIYVN